jgi:hypothetical protein
MGHDDLVIIGEARLPSEFYAHHMLRFARDHVIGEEEVRKLVHDHGFSIANLSSRLSEGGQRSPRSESSRALLFRRQ